ncbi:MAG: Holliday junction resolvase RuvX [Bacillota bacterium]
MGRTMALDVGSKTIGVAVSDPLGWTGQGVAVIRRKNRESDLAEVLRLVREWDVTELVVGLPLSLDGSRGPQAQQAETFARRLAEASGLPVRLQDERLTTRQAERVLVDADVSRRRRRQVIDKAAAVLILQSYLDSRRPRDP